MSQFDPYYKRVGAIVKYEEFDIEHNRASVRKQPRAQCNCSLLIFYSDVFSK